METAVDLAALQYSQVVAPADFSHQLCEFLHTSVHLKKGLHPPEVGCRKTCHTGKLVLQISSQLLDNCLPLLSIGSTYELW